MNNLKFKTPLILGLCLASLWGNAQTVTGTGSAGYLSKWMGSSNITNSILRDNGTTLSLGNYSSLPSPPSDYFFHIYANSFGGYTIGIDAELFNQGTTAKGFVANVQNNINNYGVDAYTAGGTNSIGGNFAAANSFFCTGIKASALGNNSSSFSATGGQFFARDAFHDNIGLEVGVSGNGWKNNGIFITASTSSTIGESIGVEASVSGGEKSKGCEFGASDATLVYGADITAIPSGITTSSYGLYAESDASIISGTSPALMNYGIMSYARVLQNADKNYGISTIAEVHDDNTVDNYGIKVSATATNSNATNNFGIYAAITGGSSSSYAGYFAGDVLNPNGAVNAAFFNGSTITSGPGLYTISDQKFKENIQEYKEGLQTILKLLPKTYTMKGKDEFPTFNFSKEKQYGFIAQEIEKIIPEMVHEAVNPPLYDTSGKKIGDAVSFKAVNYTVLIPVLVSAIQEQQKMIDDQQIMIGAKDSKINELEERIKRLEAIAGNSGNNNTDILTTTNTDGIKLYQNTPNPFGNSTEIGYSLPKDIKQATIAIFDMNGRQLKTFPVNSRGKGSITVSGSELAAGMYLYSLILDGQEVVTKRMVVNK